MVVEQRIGRVDRIGQTYEVLALNLLLDNSIDKRVYEVVEIKLGQIMAELGIDKTSDVLDSTLERDSLNRLYLTSLLNPERFEQESQDWLDDIKQKLRNYQSTEGALPTVQTSAIRAEKTDAIKYSPLPNWLEKLTTSYLSTKCIPFHLLQDGLRFRFPGYKDQVYTFDIRESLNNPIPEPLSLQHEIVQTILSEAVPVNASASIPVVSLTNSRNITGYWSLWQLEVRNKFSSQQVFMPLFRSDAGDVFPAFAQDMWTKVASEIDSLVITGLLPAADAVRVFEQQAHSAEDLLSGKYRETEALIESETERVRHNKENAFDFQERQLLKVGIENIRQARLQRLQQEKESWERTFNSARQVIPDLKCLLIIRVENG